MKRLLTLLLVGLVSAAAIIGVVVLLTPLPDDDAGLVDGADLVSSLAADVSDSPGNPRGADQSVSGRKTRGERTSISSIGEDASLGPNLAKSESESLTLVLPEASEEIDARSLQGEIEDLPKFITALLPFDAASWHLAGQIESELNHSKAAEEYWTKCLELKPKHFGPYLGFSELLMATGRLPEAVKLLQSVFEQGGSSPEVYVKLGEAYEDLGQLDDARKTFLDALERFPDEPTLLFRLGRIQVQAGEVDEAEKNLRASMSSDEDMNEKLLGLINALVKQGKREEALQAREKLNELMKANQGPSTPTFQTQYDESLRRISGTVFEDAGLLCKEHGKLNEAVMLLLRSVQLDRRRTTSWIALGEALSQQRRYGDAIAVLHRVIELEPKQVVHRINLAATCSQLGRIEQAEASLREALQVEPESLLVRIALSKFYYGLGRYDEALPLAEGVAAEVQTPAVTELLAAIYDGLGNSAQANQLRESLPSTNQR